MELKDLRGLMEAYSQVHQPEQVDELEEGIKGERNSMRRMAAAERAAERKERGGAAPRMPGREGPSAGNSYADYQQVSIAAHDKATKKNKNIVGLVSKEEVEIDEATSDIFDIVLEFLQAEGFAETLEEAEWMMANVIDEEAIDIILGEGMTMKVFKQQRSRQKQKEKRAAEKTSPTRRANMSSYERAVRHRVSADPDYDRDHEERDYPGGVTKNPKKIRKAKALGEIGEEYVDEAQAARENPEKYEAGEKKKYAPVRGERTPMPPRGDKRREDFEKWYRANVR